MANEIKTPILGTISVNEQEHPVEIKILNSVGSAGSKLHFIVGDQSLITLDYNNMKKLENELKEIKC